jgi:hypothetical protein
MFILMMPFPNMATANKYLTGSAFCYKRSTDFDAARLGTNDWIRVARFFLVQNTKIYQIYQMAIKYL